MRRYDDPVDVRKGMVGSSGAQVEGPEQFLWRGRLWKVCEILAHWVETGPWWQSSGVHAVLGAEQDGADADRDRGAVAVSTGHPTGQSTGHSTGHPTGQLIGHQDLVAEREVWRVEATRGMATAAGSRGVFDLVFDWAQGSWQLTRCVD